MSRRSIVTLLGVAAFAAIAALVTIGFSGGGGTPAEVGDELLLEYPNDPDTLNPITANDTVSEAFQRQIYELLADRDFADPDKWVPVLATHWEFDEKNLEYTIHLRRGVKWHPLRLPNGRMLPETELTASDVKFTFDCILNKHVEAASIRSYYEDPEAKDDAHRYKIKVSIVDKYTVKVRWTKPYFLAQEFTLRIAIIPRHVFSVDRNGEPIALNFALREFGEGFNSHWANTMMCGTGPLMYQEWTRNQRLVLTANPNYWGKPFPFQRMVYQCIPNSNTAKHKLLQNDLDFVAIADKDQWVQCKDDPPVEQGKVKLVSYQNPGYRYVGYNLNRPLFKDAKFRWALSHAIPVQKIIDEVFLGLAVRTTGPFMPGSTSYNDKLPPVSYDLDEARRLLAEAGWKTGSDGFLVKTIDNRPVTARFDLMIYADAPSYSTVAEIIKENCRKLGIDVQISTTKWALMLEKLNNREFDATMLGWGGVWQEDPFQIWHGSLADQPYSSNFIGYRNPRVDKLIDQLRVTLDAKEQISLYHEIHRLIYEDQPYTFLFCDEATAGYDAQLENVKFYKIRPCVDVREWRAKYSRNQ